MLEGLDRIPWADMHHERGSADDVPNNILALTSPDRDTRDVALGLLACTMYHAGMIHEPAAHAVPFLVELAANPEIEGRSDILRFLRMLARGYSPLDNVRCWYPKRFDQLQQSEGFEAQLAVQRGWVRATHHAISTHIPTYARLLDDRELDVRGHAALLLGNFEDEAARCFDILRAQTESGKCDHRIVVTCLFSMRRYEQVARSHPEVFKPLLREDSCPAVRLAAAIALAHTMRAKVPQDAVDVLAADLNAPVVVDDHDWNRPWLADNPFTKCAYALGLAGPAAISALPALIKFLENGYADPGAAIMLGIVFPAGKLPSGRTFADLSEPEKTVLRALAASRTLWDRFDPDKGHKDGNVMALLGSYGLPNEPTSFRAFVDGTGPGFHAL
jgi:hypothetical protein